MGCYEHDNELPGSIDVGIVLTSRGIISFARMIQHKDIVQSDKILVLW
jgi:hypothetical protein